MAFSIALISTRALQETRLPLRIPNSLKASPVNSTSGFRWDLSPTTGKPQRPRISPSSVSAAGSMVGPPKCRSGIFTETTGNFAAFKFFLIVSVRSSRVLTSATSVSALLVSVWAIFFASSVVRSGSSFAADFTISP